MSYAKIGVGIYDHLLQSIFPVHFYFLFIRMVLLLRPYDVKVYAPLFVAVLNLQSFGFILTFILHR